MPKILELKVITRSNVEGSTTLEEIIKERRLLKTKIKLLHIVSFDKDLKLLNKEGLDIRDLRIADFRLTPTYGLYAPIYNKIGDLRDNSDSKLRSYLIYLSYLYNIDLLTLYQENYPLFYEIIISIELPVDIKMNIFALRKYNDGFYFSDASSELNSAEYREQQSKDEQKIRELIKNVK
jgi:hypothetical protein